MIKNNTDPFTINVSGFNRLIQITNRFILRSTNIIYCIACTPSKMNYIGETEEDYMIAAASNLVI